jgi:hypothetical protein
MLREHVLSQVEDRPHLYNNLVVIIEEMERNAKILRPMEEEKTTNHNKSHPINSKPGSSWNWFRSFKKASIVPLSSPPPPQQQSSSSPKLYCKKGGRPTSKSRFQDLAVLDVLILMSSPILEHYPQLEATLLLLRKRLQTEAVTLERCQSKWDAAMQQKCTTTTTTTTTSRVEDSFLTHQPSSTSAVVVSC